MVCSTWAFSKDEPWTQIAFHNPAVHPELAHFGTHTQLFMYVRLNTSKSQDFVIVGEGMNSCNELMAETKHRAEENHEKPSRPLLSAIAILALLRMQRRMVSPCSSPMI